MFVFSGQIESPGFEGGRCPPDISEEVPGGLLSVSLGERRQEALALLQRRSDATFAMVRTSARWVQGEAVGVG